MMVHSHGQTVVLYVLCRMDYSLYAPLFTVRANLSSKSPRISGAAEFRPSTIKRAFNVCSPHMRKQVSLAVSGKTIPRSGHMKRALPYGPDTVHGSGCNGRSVMASSGIVCGLVLRASPIRTGTVLITS